MLLTGASYGIQTTTGQSGCILSGTLVQVVAYTRKQFCSGARYNLRQVEHSKVKTRESIDKAYV